MILLQNQPTYARCAQCCLIFLALACSSMRAPGSASSSMLVPGLDLRDLIQQINESDSDSETIRQKILKISEQAVKTRDNFEKTLSRILAEKKSHEINALIQEMLSSYEMNNLWTEIRELLELKSLSEDKIRELQNKHRELKNKQKECCEDIRKLEQFLDTCSKKEPQTAGEHDWTDVEAFDVVASKLSRNEPVATSAGDDWTHIIPGKIV